MGLFSVALPPYLTIAITLLTIAITLLVFAMAYNRLVDGAHMRRIDRCDEVRTDVDFARFQREKHDHAELRTTLATLLPIVVPQIIAAYGPGANVPPASVDYACHGASPIHGKGIQPPPGYKPPPDRGPDRSVA